MSRTSLLIAKLQQRRQSTGAGTRQLEIEQSSISVHKDQGFAIHLKSNTTLDTNAPKIERFKSIDHFEKKDKFLYRDRLSAHREKKKGPLDSAISLRQRSYLIPKKLTVRRQVSQENIHDNA